MTVLESQHDAEVAFERTADRVAGQCPQELAAGLLIGWGHLVLPERGVGVLGLVINGRADDLPRVGQRVADDRQEPGVVEIAAFGGGQHVGGNVERHKTS